MKHLGTYQRRAFLKDHPPVSARVLLGSSGTEQTLLAGAVLGLQDGKHYAHVDGMAADAVLAEDVTVPVAGDKYALAYVHAAAVASELVWDESVTAAQQKTALEALRLKGIYASEA